MPLFYNGKAVKDPKDWEAIGGKPKTIYGSTKLGFFFNSEFLNRHLFLKTIIYKIAIFLHIIRSYSWFDFIVYDEQGKVVTHRHIFNAIVNAGAQAMGNLLIGASTYTLNNVNVGTSNSSTTNTMTDLVAPAAGGGRQTATSRTISASAPYIITIAAFIGSGVYTRPVTIQEIAVYFDPNVTGAMFARSVITSTTLNSGNTATLSYGILLQ